MEQYIYGKHAVIQMLESEKKIEKLYLGIQDETIVQLANQRNLTITPMKRNQMNELVKTDKHQGVIIVVAPYEYVSLEQMIAKQPKSKHPLLLMLDGLQDPHNLGAILRTCDALNVDGIIIGKNRSVSLNATVAKVSTGAIDYVDVAAVTNLSRTLQQLKKEGYWVVGTALEGACDYRQVDYDMPTVIVIGGEGFGVSDLVLKQCDFKVKVPMVGHVNSLNASVATAVLLYQVYNSRNPI